MSDSKDSDQLDLLMKYTSSHMMIFIGVIAAVISAYKYIEPPFKSYTSFSFIAAGTCFLFAGVAIGMIASYIPHSKNYDEFVKGREKGMDKEDKKKNYL